MTLMCVRLCVYVYVYVLPYRDIDIATLLCFYLLIKAR